MDDILDEIEPEIFLTDKEIFTEIWTRPRMVFKFIHKNAYDKHVTILLLLAGISSSIDRAMTKNLGDHLSLISIIALTVIAGGLLGWISYYIYAALVSWTGKWLDGDQDTNSVLRVFSYAMIPTIIGLVLVLIQILLYGNDMFRSDAQIFLEENIISSIIFYSLILAEFALSIWSIVLAVIALSEIQQFSIGKALLNCILPMLVIILPFLLLFVLLDFF